MACFWSWGKTKISTLFKVYNRIQLKIKNAFIQGIMLWEEGLTLSYYTDVFIQYIFKAVCIKMYWLLKHYAFDQRHNALIIKSIMLWLKSISSNVLMLKAFLVNLKHNALKIRAVLSNECIFQFWRSECSRFLQPPRRTWQVINKGVEHYSP